MSLAFIISLKLCILKLILTNFRLSYPYNAAVIAYCGQKLNGKVYLFLQLYK